MLPFHEAWCLACLCLGEEAEPGAWEWICQLELGHGVQTFSCMHGDQEESSEEGIQVAHRPPGSYHLAFPHQQLARIRKKSPECEIYKGLVEEGAWGTSRQRKAAKGGLTCQPESRAAMGRGSGLHR